LTKAPKTTPKAIHKIAAEKFKDKMSALEHREKKSLHRELSYAEERKNRVDITQGWLHWAVQRGGRERNEKNTSHRVGGLGYKTGPVMETV